MEIPLGLILLHLSGSWGFELLIRLIGLQSMRQRPSPSLPTLLYVPEVPGLVL